MNETDKKEVWKIDRKDFVVNIKLDIKSRTLLKKQ